MIESSGSHCSCQINAGGPYGLPRNPAGAELNERQPREIKACVGLARMSVARPAWWDGELPCQPSLQHGGAGCPRGSSSPLYGSGGGSAHHRDERGTNQKPLKFLKISNYWQELNCTLQITAEAILWKATKWQKVKANRELCPGVGLQGMLTSSPGSHVSCTSVL